MGSDNGPSNDDVLGWTAMFGVCLMILALFEHLGIINLFK